MKQIDATISNVFPHITDKMFYSISVLKIDAIQIMFDCLSDNNSEVKLEAQR
jgi:hypothetical protein